MNSDINIELKELTRCYIRKLPKAQQIILPRTQRTRIINKQQ